MQHLPDNCSPEDLRTYRKRVGGLYAIYGALVMMTFGIVLAGQWSKNPAHEPTVAEAVSKKMPASIHAPTAVRQAAK